MVFYLTVALALILNWNTSLAMLSTVDALASLRPSIHYRHKVLHVGADQLVVMIETAMP